MNRTRFALIAAGVAVSALVFHAQVPAPQSAYKFTEIVPGQPDRMMGPYQGDFFWQDAGATRTIKNTGATRLEFVEFEFK